jgi:2-oxoisovalerate dehydrogenase E2 component (dihydrolipoyl transacylase)
LGARSIKMPDVGEGVAEAEIVEWAVKVGDLVHEDQVVAAVMTDKATVEVPTPVAGAVIALGGGVGDVLAVGAELIRIEAPGLPDSPPSPPAKGAAKAAAAPASAAAKPAAALPAKAPALVAGEAPKAPPPAAAPPPPRMRPAAPQRGAPRPVGEKPLASPAVRLRAREAGVDLRFVRGTGPAGRITHDDLDAYIARPPEAPAKAPRKDPSLAVERIKVAGLRRRIAQNMAESARRVAHFSYV